MESRQYLLVAVRPPDGVHRPHSGNPHLARLGATGMERAVTSLEDITASKENPVDRASEGHTYCYYTSNYETG